MGAKEDPSLIGNNLIFKKENVPMLYIYTDLIFKFKLNSKLETGLYQNSVFFRDLTQSSNPDHGYTPEPSEPQLFHQWKIKYHSAYLMGHARCVLNKRTSAGELRNML